MEEIRQEKEAESKKVQILALFFLFLVIGAFTIGGGYAMIPLIRREIVEKKKWISSQDFLDNLAIAQSLPGPIAVNFSLVTGYRLRGLKGALFSLLGAVIPSFLFILGIVLFLWQYRENDLIQTAFLGIRPVIVALILSAVFKLGKEVFKNYQSIIFFLLFLSGMFFLQLHPIAVIIAGAALGYLLPPVKNQKERSDSANHNGGAEEKLPVIQNLNKDTSGENN